MANHNTNMSEARNRKPSTHFSKLPTEIKMMIMRELIPEFQDDDSLIHISEKDMSTDLRIGGVSIFGEIGEEERAEIVRRGQDTPSVVLDMGRADELLTAAATEVFWSNTTFSFSVEHVFNKSGVYHVNDYRYVLRPALLRRGLITPTDENDADLRERQLIHDIAPQVRRLVLETHGLEEIRDWWSFIDSYKHCYPHYCYYELEGSFYVLDREICKRNGNPELFGFARMRGELSDNQRHDQIRKEGDFACVRHLTLYTSGPVSLAWRSPPRETTQNDWGFYNVGLQLPLTSETMMFAFRIIQLFPALQEVRVLRDDLDSWVESDDEYSEVYTHNPSLDGQSRYGPEGKAEQWKQLLAHDKAVEKVFDMMIADYEKAKRSQHSFKDGVAAFWDTTKVKIKAALKDEGARSS